MIRSIPILAAAPVLLLAACQGQSAGNEAAPSDPNAVLTDNGVPTDQAVVLTDTAADLAAVSQAESDRALAQPIGKAFPTDFQGRWGLVANDCTSTRGDNKGLLTVEGDRLRFYESVGTVTTLTIATPTQVTAELKFEGEGQSWRRTTQYSVSNDGKTLTRTETDPDEPSTPLRYQKCG